MQDATIFDQESELLADIVLADVPCSGYGVIGKKPDIKYRANTAEAGGDRDSSTELSLISAAELCEAQRRTLIFSTCTIAKEENEENMMWFMQQSIRLSWKALTESCLPEELHSETTALGHLQLFAGSS